MPRAKPPLVTAGPPDPAEALADLLADTRRLKRKALDRLALLKGAWDTRDGCRLIAATADLMALQARLQGLFAPVKVQDVTDTPDPAELVQMLRQRGLPVPPELDPPRPADAPRLGPNAAE